MVSMTGMRGTCAQTHRGMLLLAGWLAATLHPPTPMLWQALCDVVDALLLLLVWFWVDGWIWLHCD